MSIDKSPTPEIISWTEPLWKLVHHAVEESERLGMDFGVFNGPSYESSGGVWMTPELSMQEICWSQKRNAGDKHISIILDRASVDPHANHPYPLFNPKNRLSRKADNRGTENVLQRYYRTGSSGKGNSFPKSIISLTEKMKSNG